MRDERDSYWKRKNNFHSSNMFPEIAARVENWVSTSGCGAHVVSAEGISLLRFDDEMERLRELFGQCSTSIVLFIRNKSDWMRSYRDTIGRLSGLSDNAEDFNYVEPDSWLLDFETRVAAFQRAFGKNKVRLLDYDEALAKHGSVIPAFLRTIGAIDKFSPAEWRDIWENRSNTSA
jgi:hypothetical protein